MFQSWLSGKVFASQSELARTVGLAQPTVSAYVAIANYPEALIQAFGDPRQIAMRWWQPPQPNPSPCVPTSIRQCSAFNSC